MSEMELLELIVLSGSIGDCVNIYEGKFDTTQEWLVGGFAGRSFTADTLDESLYLQIEYLNNHIGHESMVGRIVTDSGWPNYESVKSLLEESAKEQMK